MYKKELIYTKTVQTTMDLPVYNDKNTKYSNNILVHWHRANRYPSKLIKSPFNHTLLLSTEFIPCTSGSQPVLSKRFTRVTALK